MKIAFCCGCLEPGRDGVGDYVRRLCGEFNRAGHSAFAIALNDPHVSRLTPEDQSMEGAAVSVLRIPPRVPWPNRVVEAQVWLAGHRPDCLSLQFVPFAFHSRGLCLGLGRHLKTLGGDLPWHVMFHELWLGLGERSSMKTRLWGAFQRRGALDVVRCLQPLSVHTQAEPYRVALEKYSIRASLLPLFGNIPVTDGDGWADLVSPPIAVVAKAPVNRAKLYLAGVLGAVHPEWDPVSAIETVLPLAQSSQKQLALIFLGKNNLAPAALRKIRADLRNRALVVSLGERPGGEISEILRCLDLGLATSPLQAIQKSGSVAAMLEHGLPILVTRDDWKLRGAAVRLSGLDPRIFTARQFSALSRLPSREASAAPSAGVKRVAAQMLAALPSPVVPASSVQLEAMEPLADSLP